jgi:hypothetical protein
MIFTGTNTYGVTSRGYRAVVPNGGTVEIAVSKPTATGETPAAAAAEWIVIGTEDKAVLVEAMSDLCLRVIGTSYTVA